MKRITILCLSLILSVTALAETSGKSVQSQVSIKDFWQKFKEAVREEDIEALVTLSKFPIEMSYGIASVKNKAQLHSRYREVFNEQTNAAQCFDKAQPQVDAEDPKRFTVACPDTAGNEVVIYHFIQIKTGWRFTALDNINE